MENICKGVDLPANVCKLTASTGLSLAESISHLACSDAAPPGSADALPSLIGRATSFFSYSWTGTRLTDMLEAIDHIILSLEGEHGMPPRYVFVDMFCLSQNLLCGAYLPPTPEERARLKASSPADFKARKEDTDHCFEDAIAAVGEIYFYAAPLLGEWDAPPHAFLVASHAPVEPQWRRQGPCALTRAWCIFELAKAISKGCKVHILLPDADMVDFLACLEDEQGYPAISNVLGKMDVQDAQISKTDDRDYILGQCEKLEGGISEINATVKLEMQRWIAREGKAALDRLKAAPEKRDESGRPKWEQVMYNYASMVFENGFPEEAIPMYRELIQVGVEADDLEQKCSHEFNLSLALQQMALKRVPPDRALLEEAEAILKPSLAAIRDYYDRYRPRVDLWGIQGVVLGEIYMDLARFDEAEPLVTLARAVADVHGRDNMEEFVWSHVRLVDFYRAARRFDDADEAIEGVVEVARGLSANHYITLEIESVAARLRFDRGEREQGRAELAALVARMREHVGHHHQVTMKYQGVLDAMPIAY